MTIALPSVPREISTKQKRIESEKIGVMLINLGTPDGTDYQSMRRYLKEFLSDPRVVEAPRLMWWFILNCFILVFRPGKSAKAYESIWNREKNESPLRTITRNQAKKITTRLSTDTSHNVEVDWGMRYGKPSLANCMQSLQQKGCTRILTVPLYPQYSAATTATVFDKIADHMRTLRWQPTLRTLPPYYHHPAYIEALAKALVEGIKGLDFEPEKVVASFHGVPKFFHEKGDPYYRQCLETSALLVAKLGWDEGRLLTTFQSRVGREEWLQPYTDTTITALAKDGVKRMVVITPGFSADCVETLEEISMENAEYFLENGGERFSAIPCLNDSETGIDMLEVLIRNELAGWI